MLAKFTASVASDSAPDTASGTDAGDAPRGLIGQPWGRQEEWLDSPEGWPSRPTYSGWPDSPDIARVYGPKDSA